MALARAVRLTRGLVRAPLAGMRTLHACIPAAMAEAPQDPADFEPLELEDALSSEINFEKNTAEGDFITKEEIESDLKSAFQGFNVDVQEGTTTIKLTRVVDDTLDVAVVVDLCSPEFMPPSGDDEDEEEADEQMTMSLQGRMTVVRQGSDKAVTFVFHVPTAADAGVELLNVVTHEATPKLAADTTVSADIPIDAYSPSNFEDLDFALQASFVKFMGRCGLDVEFAEATRAVADRKEQFEYLAWLARCHGALETTAR